MFEHEDFKQLEELIKQAKKNVSAKKKLFQRFYQPVYTFVCRLCRYYNLPEKNEAEDIIMVTFAKAFRSFSTLRHHHAFVSWLKRIAYTCFMDRFRQIVIEENRNKSLDEPLKNYKEGNKKTLAEILPAFTPSPDWEMSASEVFEIVRKILPVEQFYVVTLRILEGNSEAETAGILGIPLGTVKSRYSRAIDTLKNSSEIQGLKLE